MFERAFGWPFQLDPGVFCSKFFGAFAPPFTPSAGLGKEGWMGWCRGQENDLPSLACDESRR